MYIEFVCCKWSLTCWQHMRNIRKWKKCEPYEMSQKNVMDRSLNLTRLKQKYPNTPPERTWRSHSVLQSTWSQSKGGIEVYSDSVLLWNNQNMNIIHSPLHWVLSFLMMTEIMLAFLTILSSRTFYSFYRFVGQSSFHFSTLRLLLLK